MTQKLPIQIDRGDGDPLLLIHGLGNNHKSWQFVLRHLDYKKWRVLAIDLLGFGGAPKPNITYTPAEHAEAVISTLDSLNIEKVTIAGHSMGCLVAIEIAHRRPERVENLILLGAPLYKSKPRNSWWRRITRAEGIYFSIFEFVKKNPDAVQAGGSIADELVPFIKGLEITEETWPAYKKSLENTIMQTKSYNHATKLQVPTLFVNGIFDFFIIRRNIKNVRKANKNFVRIKTNLGPHEITPSQGRSVANIINKVKS